jgi:hypothetical protein
MDFLFGTGNMIQNLTEEQYQEIWCNIFHKDSHERYTDSVDCHYGPSVYSGLRCKKCHREWPDPEVVAKFEHDWREEQARRFYVIVGNKNKSQILSLQGEWGDTTAFEYRYNSWKKYLEENNGDTKNLGPLNKKFFVFHSDCNGQEWNAVSQTKAKEIWAKKRLTYKQAIDKIKNTEKYYRDINEQVMKSVFRGLEDAAKGRYSENPPVLEKSNEK